MEGWGASSNSRPVLPRKFVKHLPNKRTYRPRLERAWRPTNVSSSSVLVRGDASAQRCRTDAGAKHTVLVVATPNDNCREQMPGAPQGVAPVPTEKMATCEGGRETHGNSNLTYSKHPRRISQRGGARKRGFTSEFWQRRTAN